MMDPISPARLPRPSGATPRRPSTLLTLGRLLLLTSLACTAPRMPDTPSHPREMSSESLTPTQSIRCQTPTPAAICTPEADNIAVLAHTVADETARYPQYSLRVENEVAQTFTIPFDGILQKVGVVALPRTEGVLVLKIRRVQRLTINGQSRLAIPLEESANLFRPFEVTYHAGATAAPVYFDLPPYARFRVQQGELYILMLSTRNAQAGIHQAYANLAGYGSGLFPPNGWVLPFDQSQPFERRRTTATWRPLWEMELPGLSPTVYVQDTGWVTKDADLTYAVWIEPCSNLCQDASFACPRGTHCSPDLNSCDTQCACAPRCLGNNGGCPTNTTCHWTDPGPFPSGNPQDCPAQTCSCEPPFVLTADGQCVCPPGKTQVGDTCVCDACGTNNGGCPLDAMCVNHESADTCTATCTCPDPCEGQGSSNACSSSVTCTPTGPSTFAPGAATMCPTALVCSDPCMPSDGSAPCGGGMRCTPSAPVSGACATPVCTPLITLTYTQPSIAFTEFGASLPCAGPVTGTAIGTTEGMWSAVPGCGVCTAQSPTVGHPQRVLWPASSIPSSVPAIDLTLEFEGKVSGRNYTSSAYPQNSVTGARRPFFEAYWSRANFLPRNDGYHPNILLSGTPRLPENANNELMPTWMLESNLIANGGYQSWILNSVAGPETFSVSTVKYTQTITLAATTINGNGNVTLSGKIEGDTIWPGIGVAKGLATEGAPPNVSGGARNDGTPACSGSMPTPFADVTIGGPVCLSSGVITNGSDGDGPPYWQEAAKCYNQPFAGQFMDVHLKRFSFQTDCSACDMANGAICVMSTRGDEGLFPGSPFMLTSQSTPAQFTTFTNSTTAPSIPNADLLMRSCACPLNTVGDGFIPSFDGTLRGTSCTPRPVPSPVSSWPTGQCETDAECTPAFTGSSAINASILQCIPLAGTNETGSPIKGCALKTCTADCDCDAGRVCGNAPGGASPPNAATNRVCIPAP